MSLVQKLSMRQSQSLRMTPQLSQSIKLLAFSNIELESFVDQEIDKNPFLEKAQDRIEREEALPMLPAPVAPTEDSIVLDTSLATSAGTLSAELGTDLRSEFPDDPLYAPGTSRTASNIRDSIPDIRSGLPFSRHHSADDTAIAERTASTPSLRDHLTGQLQCIQLSPEISALTARIILNLDEAGYLAGKLEELAIEVSAPQNALETALAIVQALEPAGVGARNLAECLRLQLKDRNRHDPAIELVLQNLDLLARRDFEALRRITGLDDDDLMDILNEIRSCDPKPGTGFDSNPVQHVVPDVLVTEAGDGSWHVELNDQTLPKLLINNTYAAEVERVSGGEENRTFIAENLQNANWLARSLDQRARTILNVAKEIVKRQDAFLLHGVQHLKPLTLRTVADAIDMHESSVSRATSSKYMMTPRGLFEMKYFFTTSLPSTGDGEGHSSEAVRAQIRALIDTETASSVLSDDAIVTALRMSGIDIARRTVAKYRDAMNIASSVQRRRELRARSKVTIG